MVLQVSRGELGESSNWSFGEEVESPLFWINLLGAKGLSGIHEDETT